MSSSQLFILETPSAKAVMHAQIWSGDWHQSPWKGESLALSSGIIPGVQVAPVTEKARGTVHRGAGASSWSSGGWAGWEKQDGASTVIRNSQGCPVPCTKFKGDVSCWVNILTEIMEV